MAGVTKRVKKGRLKTAELALLVLIGLLLLSMVAPPCAVASVEKVEGGIKFTYYDPDAGQVFLAGSFNNWSANATAMKRDDAGYWTVVLSLAPGKYEYKFVVDGAWITDLDNPNSKPDPYGGMNSVVEIDSKGNIVQRGAVQRITNTPLNARIYIGGRYLTRMSTEKGAEGDTRWRMQRPTNKIDFNFNITISEMVRGYTRLRFDSSRNLFQPNNISAYLDEAHIEIAPGPFKVLGFYNEEVLLSHDPLPFIGDVDLPGTIFDDHLNLGKGMAGLVITSERHGFNFEGIASNIHDYDIYNDPNLFDNTGTDLYGARVSKNIKWFEVAVDFFMQRNLWWLDFTSLVGTTPSNTGIPRLDEHIDKTGDQSDWFEFDDRTFYGGCDFALHLYEDKLVPQFEYLRGKFQQRFVTSNRSGIDLGNGPIDVTILDRDAQIIMGRVTTQPRSNIFFEVEHHRYQIMNGGELENQLVPKFLPDDQASKHIFFDIVSDPPNSTYDHTEMTLSWSGSKLDARVWIQRDMYKYNYPYEGTNTWKYTLSFAPGIRWQAKDKITLELEQNYMSFDGTSTLSDKGFSVETITRGTLDITKKFSAIFDIRVIRYSFDRSAEGVDSKTFVSPFAGFMYRPMRKVSVVLAYGLDPLDFNIDYNGRHLARFNYRNQYLWQNPSASPLDAEEALADYKAITLRAIFNF